MALNQRPTDDMVQNHNHNIIIDTSPRPTDDMAQNHNHDTVKQFSHINAYDFSNLSGACDPRTQAVAARKKYAADHIDFLKYLFSKGSPFERATARVMLQELEENS